ncbi:hypothetical protein [uncultured Pseudokineococcus sp.]|uniref:hypothetical protein n=1 Tax=uncultured Pseudokineococcus sp. TaxID=1642928 RepID=UPI00262B90B0|nr:hypothetical protein [uncultured Pseudokineococcus sp.]
MDGQRWIGLGWALVEAAGARPSWEAGEELTEALDAAGSLREALSLAVGAVETEIGGVADADGLRGAVERLVAAEESGRAVDEDDVAGVVARAGEDGDLDDELAAAGELLDDYFGSRGGRARAAG